MFLHLESRLGSMFLCKRVLTLALLGKCAGSVTNLLRFDRSPNNLYGRHYSSTLGRAAPTKVSLLLGLICEFAGGASVICAPSEGQ